MVSMLAFVSGIKTRLSDEEKGATAVEYGIMVALIAVVIIGAVSAFGNGLFDTFNDVTREIGGTVATRP
jgi:pilus assembly protein Flp/PilA